MYLLKLFNLSYEDTTDVIETTCFIELSFIVLYWLLYKTSTMEYTHKGKSKEIIMYIQIKGCSSTVCESF